MDTPQIEHAPKKNRYVIKLGRDTIGYTQYVDQGAVRHFLHTEVSPDYSGHGLATQLIQWSLDDTRAAGMSVVPRCPTVTSFIEKRPEYQDLLEPRSA